MAETPAAAEPVAAALAAMADRNEAWITHQALTEATVRDSPFGDLRRALAALRMVLAAHRDTGGRCAWCRESDGKRSKWPCGEYLVVRRELLGEEGSDE